MLATIDSEFGPNLLYSLLHTSSNIYNLKLHGRKMSVPLALADIEKSTVSIWVYLVVLRSQERVTNHDQT
jgi:hypothetical protein